MKQKHIDFDLLKRMCFANSKKVPRFINHNGVRKEWVGIGWIDLGQPKGDEVIVDEEKA